MSTAGLLFLRVWGAESINSISFVKRANPTEVEKKITFCRHGTFMNYFQVLPLHLSRGPLVQNSNTVAPCVIQCNFLPFFSMSGRGHRRLRLSSRKYYERNKYQKKALLAKTSTEDIYPPCRISIPLAVINQAPSKNLESLQSRLRKVEAIANGEI